MLTAGNQQLHDPSFFSVYIKSARPLAISMPADSQPEVKTTGLGVKSFAI